MTCDTQFLIYLHCEIVLVKKMGHLSYHLKSSLHFLDEISKKKDVYMKSVNRQVKDAENGL